MFAVKRTELDGEEEEEGATVKVLLEKKRFSATVNKRFSL
jgi:hypothetical protein